MFNVVKKTFTYGAHQVTLETGEIARQATGAVVVRIGETVVLVTVVAAKETRDGQDFFPLPLTIRKNSMQQGAFPAAFSSGKAVLPKRKF